MQNLCHYSQKCARNYFKNFSFCYLQDLKFSVVCAHKLEGNESLPNDDGGSDMMYTLKITSIYSQGWYTEYEFDSVAKCYDFIHRNYPSSMEDPDTPYMFEIRDYRGDVVR